MKEILEGARRAFSTIPEDFRDKATVKVASFYLISGKNHGLPGGRNQAWGFEMADRWYKGEPTPLAEFATKLFDPQTFNIENDGAISQGAGIIVMNQTNEGPLRGNWFKFVVSYAASQARAGDKYAARFVQKEESSNDLLQKSPFGIQKSRLSRMIARSCQTILVSEQATPRQNVKALIEMKRHLDNRGLLVICPEGVDSSSLKRGTEQSGDLIKMLAKKQDLPIQPVGAYYQEGRLNLHFGNPTAYSEVSPDVLTGQELSDTLMQKIAQLVPPEKRGVYKI